MFVTRFWGPVQGRASKPEERAPQVLRCGAGRSRGGLVGRLEVSCALAGRSDSCIGLSFWAPNLEEVSFYVVSGRHDVVSVCVSRAAACAHELGYSKDVWQIAKVTRRGTGVCASELMLHH